MKFKKIILGCALLMTQVVQAQDPEVKYTAIDLNQFVVENGQFINLNSEGQATGNFEDNETYSQFAWSPSAGMVVLTNDAVKMSQPQINKNGQVAGVILEKKIVETVQPKEWWKFWGSDTTKKSETQFLSFYMYDPAAGFTSLGMPTGWENDNQRAGKVNVIGINDLGQILVSNNVLPPLATKYAIWEKGRFTNCDTLPGTPYAMNNLGDLLLESKTPLEDGKSFQITYAIYNPISEETVAINLPERSIARRMNDKREIIGTRETLEGVDGFLWSPESGVQSLGNFAPAFLNNSGAMAGYIVGPIEECNSQKGPKFTMTPAVCVKGQVVDLNEMVDFANVPGAGKITQITCINDKGQILVKALVDQKSHSLLLEPVVVAAPISAEPEPQVVEQIEEDLSPEMQAVELVEEDFSPETQAYSASETDLNTELMSEGEIVSEKREELE